MWETAFYAVLSRHTRMTRILWLFLAAILYFLFLATLQARRIASSWDRNAHVERFRGDDRVVPNEEAIYHQGPSFSHSLLEIHPQSDTVRISHCPSWSSLSVWNNFTAWVTPILQTKFFPNSKFNSVLPDNRNNTMERQFVQDEFTLQLYEIYLSTYTVCNYSMYHFHTLPRGDDSKQRTFLAAQQKLLQHDTIITSHSSSFTKSVRIVFSIVAFQDAPHLQRLIQHILLPQHVVIVHLERATSAAVQNSVYQLAAQYTNVIVLQFGTVVYETDSVSQINLEIMEWLHHHQPWFRYEYHITLGGAAFPLWHAHELNRHLYVAKQDGQQNQRQQHVWLGELRHKGQRIHHPQSMLVWNRKRLYTSAMDQKLDMRTGTIISTPVPRWLDQCMQHKSTSGNQGVYSYHVVQQLLANPRIKELFALAKYGCCCCLEERTWIAAMDILGLVNQAKDNYSMFQLWGGPADNGTIPNVTTRVRKRRVSNEDDATTCEGGMKNSVLELNDHPYACYRSEHAYHSLTIAAAGGNSEQPMMMNSSQVWENLVLAKSRGTLFARKFHSSNPRSMQLLERIIQEIHVDH